MNTRGPPTRALFLVPWSNGPIMGLLVDPPSSSQETANCPSFESSHGVPNTPWPIQ